MHYSIALFKKFTSLLTLKNMRILPNVYSKYVSGFIERASTWSAGLTL